MISSWRSPTDLRAPYVASGPESVKAATEHLMDLSEVPFPWDLPPKKSIHIYQPGIEGSGTGAGVLVPVGTQTVICQYTVPDGFQFVLRARMNLLLNGTYVQGSGEVVYTTDVNTDITIPTPQGEPIDGLQAETYDTGSTQHGPVRWYGRSVFEPRDVLRVKVLTTIGGGSAPNFFLGVLVGWIWPVDERGDA